MTKSAGEEPLLTASLLKNVAVNVQLNEPVYFSSSQLSVLSLGALGSESERGEQRKKKKKELTYEVSQVENQCLG